MFESGDLGWNTCENIVEEFELSETTAGKKGLRDRAFPSGGISENEHFDILPRDALQPIRYILSGKLPRDCMYGSGRGNPRGSVVGENNGHQI